MAQMLNIGKKFEHFSSLEISSSSIRRKKTFNTLGAVHKPLKRHSHDCHERQKYYEVTYHCIHGSLGPGVNILAIFSNANILKKNKRMKIYHIKGIGCPLLISINIVIFDQGTEK